MANSLTYNWTIFCDTEGKNIVVTQKQRPLKCPYGDDHVLIKDFTNYEIVTLPPIVTDKTKNVGYYLSEGINFACLPLTTTTHNIVYPYDITLCGATIQCKSENDNDSVSVILSPNALIGYITSDVISGDTIIPVLNDSLEYCIKGAYLTIDKEIVCIKSIDLIRSTIEITSPLISNHTPYTMIYRNVYIVKNINLQQSGCIVLGKTNPYPSYIVAGVSITIEYTNKGNVEKKFNMIIDYY